MFRVDDYSEETIPKDLASNLTRFQPEKEKQHKSLTLLINDRKLESFDLSTHSVVEDIIKQTEAEGEEPDIVKSTKTRTPPQIHTTEMDPVAPPRRRKKTGQVSKILCPPLLPGFCGKHLFLANNLTLSLLFYFILFAL